MGMSAILVDYQARIVALHATAIQMRAGQTIALAVMIAAIAAILVVGFLSIAKHKLRLPVALVPVPLVIYSGRVCRRRNTALLQALRLKAFYERGADRLQGKWSEAAPSGEEFQNPEHFYGSDLHVMGKRSLFQLLCTCRTQAGSRRLAEYLLETAPAEEILRRQEAVRELKDKTELREKICLLGDFPFQETSRETILEWLGAPATRVRWILQMAAVVSSVSVAALFLLRFASIVTWSPLTISIGALLLLLHACFALPYRRRILGAMPTIRVLEQEIRMLREGLVLLGTQRFQCDKLSRLVALASEGNAPACLRRLERLAKTMTGRDKEWFYAFSRALLIGTQTFWRIERWRTRYGKALRLWLEAWSEFEALIALAGYAYEHPDNTFPEFSQDRTAFEASGMAHPLLPAETCVANDISLNAENRFYIVSGSNMAGKSTLLRSIGLNAVLAYAGAPVAARQIVLSRFAIRASLSVQDSLLDGKSKFLAEIEKLKQALTAPPEQGPVLFLIDEILGGTNSRDRKQVAESVLKMLIEQGAVGAVSTHDLALTELADSAELPGKNVHMASDSESDPLDFDYLIKPGPATQSNAVAIARLAGLNS